MSGDAAMVLQGVSVGYRGRAVLSGVEAEAFAGRVTAVVGPNAAGKSTLLRAISGLEAPIGGGIEAMAGGRRGDPRRWAPRERAASIAFLPQRLALPAGFAVSEVVAMGRHALPRSAGRIEEAIARFGLAALADRAVHTLSVGQQQRVGLARVAAQHEAGGIVILDEPLAPLDLRETVRAVGWMKKAAAAGAAVICSLHDLGLAARIADDAWLLDEGRLVGRGAAKEVLSPGSLESIFGREAVLLSLGA